MIKNEKGERVESSLRRVAIRYNDMSNMGCRIKERKRQIRAKFEEINDKRVDIPSLL